SASAATPWAATATRSTVGRMPFALAARRAPILPLTIQRRDHRGGEPAVELLLKGLERRPAGRPANAARRHERLRSIQLRHLGLAQRPRELLRKSPPGHAAPALRRVLHVVLDLHLASPDRDVRRQRPVALADARRDDRVGI